KQIFFLAVLLSPICLFSPIAFCVFFCCILSNFPLLFLLLFCHFCRLPVYVYSESLCPDCRGYITNMLYPSSVLLGDIMDLTVVPYGNAQESFDGQRYVFTCQHGEQECLGNMIQACLLNLTKTNAFNIIFCMEAAVNVIQAAKPLFAPQLSYEKLMSCVKGDLGNHLMHQNALKTEALKPPHTFVPWITINGIHTDDLQKKAMSSLIPLVCSMYKLCGKCIKTATITRMKAQQKCDKKATKT
uniref:Gamma-interferon-inducible lysosomal thiol reductase n=1 Tax=Neogobius melanostomus TaxID=47308 RepID=A0A8C6TY26_9GOBI